MQWLCPIWFHSIAKVHCRKQILKKNMKFTEMFMLILWHVNNHRYIWRYNHNLIAEIRILFYVCWFKCFEIQIMFYISLIFSSGVYIFFLLNRNRITDLHASIEILNVKVIQGIYISFFFWFCLCIVCVGGSHEKNTQKSHREKRVTEYTKTCQCMNAVPNENR